ncbi:MAG TPA: TetR/AcrR family transcriptional regulator [Steroidobacteraceae bacterium]|nr:TetR/AcrR family transcriptional regulator [Steroidobacteraceae bacterium]
MGRDRRARTRQKILEAALGVFAGKGPDAPVIDDFIKAAGVARGTFYNYFKTTGELLTATSKWLEDELMVAIEAGIAGLDDPVERLATGLRLWLHQSRNDAVFCAFVVRNQYRGQLVERRLDKDLGEGLRSGQFAAPSMQVARDLVVGAAREAQARMMNGRVARSYPEDVACIVLRGLRVNERELERLLAAPLPQIERRAQTREGLPRAVQ